jgi:DNA-binding transcriptional LysR family regulator
MVDSGEAIRQAALAGLGIVQHSVLTLQQDIDDGRLCPVLPDYLPPPRPMHLLRLPIRPLPDRLLVYRLLFAGAKNDPLILFHKEPLSRHTFPFMLTVFILP